MSISRALARPSLPLAACLLATWACSGGSGGGGGRILRVDSSAPAGGDGSAWVSAFSDLQTALARARAGDEIWVAGGTYRPGAAGASRDSTFRLRDGVRLFGGFAATEEALEERDPLLNETILSGDLDGDDGPGFTQASENAFQVVTALHVSPSTVLDGFTIRGGYADGPGFGAVPQSREQGSGLNVYFASPRIEDCVFEGNWSLNHGALNDHGDDTLVVGCTFRGNHSGLFGAGLYVHHHSRTIALGCTFEDNEATTEGGGAYSRSMEGAAFVACTFQRNRASSGGGIYLATGSLTRLQGCTFEDNVASLGGGGVYSDEASPRIEDCTFTANDGAAGDDSGSGGDGGTGGGGLWANGGSPIVTDCDFHENLASLGAGAYFILESAATVQRCTFVGNAAFEAGGLYTLGSDVLVEDCVFLRNSALGGPFPVGGGASNYFDDSVFRRCLFVGNEAGLGGGGMYSEGEAPGIFDCVFIGNSAHGASQGWGGGMMNGYFCAPQIANCVFSRNSANLGGGVFDMVFSQPSLVNCSFAANHATSGPEIMNYIDVTGTISNCVVDGTGVPIDGVPIEVRYCLVRGGFPGVGIVDGDPGFVRLPEAGLDGIWGTDDDDLGDLRVGAASPCIDAGDNGMVPGAVEMDLAGSPRFADDPLTPDTGLGSPPQVDLGAYERAP
ncbi:MAG: right-handed parallel beta-helix repeat-containing protein [Planctomycetota bacterium]